MFPPAEILTTEVFARLPPALHQTDRPSQWLTDRHVKMHSFLEGPSFDREGNLWCVDLAHGRLLRVTPAGEFEVMLQYDGEPNGLKIHRDGRVFVADHRHGLMVHVPGSGRIDLLMGNVRREGLKGLNDLYFASNGDLYFTDQGESALEDPSGRVLRLRADGKTVDLLMSGLAGPNGLVLDEARKILYVAVTRENAIFSLPIEPDYGGMKKAGRFIQLSGATGPDGLALDEAGNLVVVHAGAGTAWVFSRIGEPLYRIRSNAGIRTTNVAYGGDDRRTLYMTESEQGAILRVRLPVAGRAMYSHS
ncbi:MULTISPECIES: SMP-30/gluconolactonase/LRE family protein [Ramlibacter]|uniref:SMP-30/gluconolactonase/LRE family protein n=1 Tax=Ramlibacter pinisoli TaxID=2682844 RepID=A0A6N8IRQ4_9BURK|nr:MULTISPECIES: SMP-30/gluconolactonase/LRE family protein [Ramlibacter]MBA2963830.1 SMP-30/gluconolactonase/LRE family protein [Ramlibacter sp. CGMCC 1.13660]MVQ28796.1 SMP-30/gluconolactonase/LRE family protein [Ramlibacter pinisoli]